MSIDALRQRLLQSDSDEDQTNTEEESETRGILSQVVQWAFLRPEKIKDADARSIGISNKDCLLKCFWNDHQDPHSHSKILEIGKVYSIYNVGMVAKKDFPYIKSSIDALVVSQKDEDNTKVIPIEIKTRVRDSRIQEAKEVTMVQSGANFVVGDVVYGSCCCAEIHQWIPNSEEQAKIIHHAFTLGLKEAIFLFGYNMRLIYGVHI